MLSRGLSVSLFLKEAQGMEEKTQPRVRQTLYKSHIGARRRCVEHLAYFLSLGDASGLATTSYIYILHGYIVMRLPHPQLKTYC